MTLSVALCTFNGGRHLPTQLASLLAQTRPPDEVVVGDDASADHTPDLLADFARAAPFPVRVGRNPHTLGSTPNFDQTIGRCTGDVVLLCDQDDDWHPDKLRRFAAAFADPRVGLVASDLELVGPAGEPLGRTLWADLPFPPAERAAVEAGGGPRRWLRANTVTGAAAGFRADLRDLVRPIPPGWVHDAWIALMAGAVSGVRLLDEPLTRYRVHPGQQIGTAPRTLRREVRAARRMDAGHFARTAEAFAAAADRLAAHRDRLLDPGLVGRVRGKAAFADAQRRMRAGTRAGRVRPAVRGLLAGDYHRFGRGLKGFAADLLL